jgi:6-phosphogluconolactonase
MDSEMRRVVTAQVVVVPDVTALATAAAGQFATIAEERIAVRHRFAVALSGGSTPTILYCLLSQPPYVDAIDWRFVHVFWGDERTVPPDHPESNYGTALDALLKHVPIPANQIHRIQGEIEPDEAAERYEEEIMDFFGLNPGEVPEFDLILLGIGADGHTASLFPGTQALDESDRLVVDNSVPTLGTVRITFTIPVITEAANVLVLAAGRDKAQAVRRAIEGPFDPIQTPAQILRTAVGPVTWLLDQAAGSPLHPRPAES